MIPAPGSELEVIPDVQNAITRLLFPLFGAMFI